MYIIWNITCREDVQGILEGKSCAIMLRFVMYPLGDDIFKNSFLKSERIITYIAA